MQELENLFQQFISHCKYEKNLSIKTIKAYESDFRQFITFFGSSFIGKSEPNFNFQGLGPGGLV